jgi:DNA helicase II / ATP-dependent DNA helicase PcrA
MAKKAVATKIENPLMEGLNTAQAEAVSFGAGPLLIVAGAGTGKTTAITRRIANLIAQGTRPDAILALTFTDKAAGEMEERVDRLLPYGYYDLWISTFHSFCERILKQHALDIGIPNDFKLLDPTQQWLLIRQNLGQFELDYYKPLGNPTKFIYALLKHISKAKDEEISPAEYLEYAEKLKVDAEDPDSEEEVKRTKEVANAYSTYQRLLLENNSLDFGDLINYALKLFRTRKRVLSQYQNKFDYILVDEFQDTNFAQYELVKLLSEGKNNLNVVGDDDQSIYKFRGASVSNIMRFRKDFPDAQQITLTENYRSTQNILDLAYNFIQLNNPERLESKLGIKKQLNSNIKEKGNIEVLCGQTLADEVDMVAKKIVEIQKREKTPWNSFAILVRANDQADAFISKLSGLGIPYTYYANKGLYKKSIIVDILSYIKVILNHHEDMALYKVLTFEPFKVGHNDLSKLLHFSHKKTLSLYEALTQAQLMPEISADSRAKINEILALIGKHSDMQSNKNIAEVFIHVVRDLKIAQRIKEDTLENLENRELLEQFYKKIEAFEADNTDKSTKSFMESLQYELEAGEEGKINFDPNQGPESVKIMTIHSSKGLEFDHVFVVNMVNLRFPSTERREAIELPEALVKETLPEGDVHLQEERRLFYVAVTRAKKGIYFSYASDYGGARTKKPSQFLVDIHLVSKPEKSAELLSRETVKVEPQMIDPELFMPETFSYTQISDFKRCPMKYKYRHLLHLPLPGSAHLSFGNTIHMTLEKFLNMYRTRLESKQLDLFSKEAISEVPPLEDLIQIYENVWVDEWYRDKKQKEQYRTKGRDILKTFYDGFVSDPLTPKYLEKSFRLKLDKYYFVGKIDRADSKENKLHIIDYKTGNTKLDKKEDRDQLLIYQWAAEDVLKEKVASLRYWYLVDNTSSEPFLGSEQEITELKNKLLDSIQAIRNAVTSNSFKELDRKAPQHDCEFEDLD